MRFIEDRRKKPIRYYIDGKETNRDEFWERGREEIRRLTRERSK